MPFIPLVSTRADVEKFATQVESHPSFVEYMLGAHRLRVFYAETRCTWHGWDVAPNTVLRYTIYPGPGIKRESLNLERNGILRTTDDVLTGYYTDFSNGIQYAFGTDGNLESAKRTPSAQDNKDKRCKGFPEYHAVADTYSMFRSYEIPSSSDWDIGYLGGLMITIKGKPLSGTVIIFDSMSSPGAFKELAPQIERYAYVIQRIPRKQLLVTFGGFRDSGEIETFITPLGYPPPNARPKYPGSH
jgi:hypothetical protein